MTHCAYLCFGSNAGCREANIEAAVRRVSGLAPRMRLSGCHESADASGLGGPYINVVAECHVEICLDELRRHLRQFEAEGGRTPASKAMGVMPVDIDIVEWDGRVISPDDHKRPYYTAARAELTHETVT